MPILLQDRYVREAMELFNQVTIALVGIGTVEPSGLLASSGNIFSSEELNMLQEAGAVGDICLRFFDTSGAPVETPLNERVIGMNLEQLRQVKRAVGIAVPAGNKSSVPSEGRSRDDSSMYSSLITLLPSISFKTVF